MLMCDCLNELFLYIQHQQCVEIFPTPGARFGYTLMYAAVLLI